MRYSTRTFLLLFLPLALLLTGSFWVIQRLVEGAVRESLRVSLRRTQSSIEKVRSKGELHNSRFLRMLSENATLKAGMQLLLTELQSKAARLTLEDQLREMCLTMELDFLLMSGSDGKPLAGVMRVGEQAPGIDVNKFGVVESGLTTIGDRIYQVVSTPVNIGDENLGMLAVGEPFDFSEFTTPAVLARNGKVLKSSVPQVPAQEMEKALEGCTRNAECELRLGGQIYLSSPVESLFLDGGYQLRSLQSVDEAGSATQAILREVFVTAGIGALLAALVLSLISSRSIVRPLAAVVSRLRSAESTGVLPEFPAREMQSRIPTVIEIRELMVSFNRAAQAHREAREKLHLAYVEFVGSLANALDARDTYTAGHSRRVSDYSCALAEAIGMADDARNELRIGALLHDIGKIGIADEVLQKPGKLTKEEFAIIQQHPGIGRRILEGVHGFHPYLPVVELHHENWDGTGYPWGLRATDVPLDARIVHVADAYDAMTSDRPYRSGMTHEAAVRVLEQCAGTQFDPELVKVFVKLEALARIRLQPVPASGIQNLATSLQQAQDPAKSEAPERA